SVVNAIDRSKFEVVPIGITKEGQWLTAVHAERLLGSKGSDHAAGSHTDPHLRAGDPAATPGAAVLASGASVIMPPVPHDAAIIPLTPQSLASPSPGNSVNVDVIFP